MGASSGAPLPLGGAPAELAEAEAGEPLAGEPLLAWEALDDGELLAGELLDALLGALLEADALALLDEELLLDELDELALELELELEELLALCCSSEKSISSGGSELLSLDEGSGGVRESSGRWSESEYTGVDWLLVLAVGSSALLCERERRLDSSPLLDAVFAWSLERSADSILGIDEFGCARLLAVDMLGLRLLGELCDGILLAVDGLDCERLELLELLEDCDWDCDGELGELDDC